MVLERQIGKSIEIITTAQSIRRNRVKRSCIVYDTLLGSTIVFQVSSYFGNISRIVRPRCDNSRHSDSFSRDVDFQFQRLVSTDSCSICGLDDIFASESRYDIKVFFGGGIQNEEVGRVIHELTVFIPSDWPIRNNGIWIVFDRITISVPDAASRWRRIRCRAMWRRMPAPR